VFHGGGIIAQTYNWQDKLSEGECSAKLSATVLQPPSFAKHPRGTAQGAFRKSYLHLCVIPVRGEKCLGTPRELRSRETLTLPKSRSLKMSAVLGKCKVGLLIFLPIVLKMLYINFINAIQTQKEKIMSYKVLFVINAIVALAVGLLLLFTPTMGLTQFNMDARVTEVFLTRVVGVALASLGLVLWFAKDSDEAVQRNLGMAALAGSALGLIVALMGVGSRIIRVNGWVLIVVFVLIALVYAFMLFLKPRLQQ
jgi:hypothetical protein